MKSENHIKPRVKFCWECGNKLWGNHHTEAIIEGHPRILHETCYKRNYSNCEKVNVVLETGNFL